MPQSEYTFCFNLSKPSSCVHGDHSSERGDHTFEYRFTPTLSGESVCGQLLIRSILVMLFSFEVPLEKKLSKKLQQKKQKETKKATTKKGLCVCFL
jgi:hypothetical protein